ncbi:hypothetical protein LEP1GSC038_1752 [Leptospira weilii str. 2006001855]|uniref:Uncharacterized protein n=1 Tax=Leptospira weilii str. 2006001855 TaxID=996804 RepID=M6FH09_9LEPT|nr:hypothetical protein LEP1GSC038_1752 [Leptospira weilii str. 2006001855]
MEKISNMNSMKNSHQNPIRILLQYGLRRKDSISILCLEPRWELNLYKIFGSIVDWKFFFDLEIRNINKYIGFIYYSDA